MDAALEELARTRPTVGLAAGVVRDGRLESFLGRGVADIGSRMPVSEDTGFRVASITKTFTAVAVLQLWERGLVDLDAPVAEYLRAYQLVPVRPDWPQPTLRHLLTHTAGLPETVHASGLLRPDFGESVPTGHHLPRPAELYGGALRVHAEPGSRFVYTNHGPTTLGQVVEDVTGVPLARYLRDHVLEPLGMSDSSLARTKAVRSRLATGYEIRARRIERVLERDMITAGAASLFSTPRDMARYLGALLDGAAGRDCPVLRGTTVAQMAEPHFQPDPRVPGMGLGFFRRTIRGHRVIGHQGTLPGFHSQVLLAPDDGVAVMAFTNGSHQADFWLPAATSRLLGTILEGSGPPEAAVAPHRPEVWVELCGWYRLRARFLDVRLRGMMGLGAEVVIRGGRPVIRFLTPVPALARGLPLEPDDANDPTAFRVDLTGDGLEPIRVLFGRDAHGSVDRLHLDVMPVTLEKHSPATNPRLWATATAGLAGAAVVTRSVRHHERRR